MARSRRALVALFALLAILSAPRAARAGAWTQPPGAAYVRVAAAGIETGRRYDGEGRLVTVGPTGDPVPTRYRDRALRLYVEYGLRDGVTLTGASAYKSVRLARGDVASERLGIADVSLAARVRVRGGRAPVAVAFEAEFPSGYETATSPTLGSGATRLTGRALWGTAFGPAYAGADAAFSYRSGGYRNEIAAGGEAGTRVWGPAYARVKARAERALGTPPDRPQGATFDPGLTSPRRVEVTATAGIGFGGGAALELGVTRALAGRDALAGSSVEAALVMAFGAAPPRSGR